MDTHSTGSADRQISLPRQASGLQWIIEWSTAMLESRDEHRVLKLAMMSVSALSTCEAEAGYLVRGDRLTGALADGSPTHPAMDDRMRGLRGGDGTVALPDGKWRWGFALRHKGGTKGYLVVTAPSKPSEDELSLLRALAWQSGAALANAALHHSHGEDALRLRQRNEECALLNARLGSAVRDLDWLRAVDEALTGIPASAEAEQGLACALHRLTGLPTVVEDRFGNLLAWAGPARPVPYPKPEAMQRQRLLHRAAGRRQPIRDGDRLIALACDRPEVLGVIALVDPGGTAGRQDELALEKGAVELAGELVHRRRLAELELRLRCDLGEDLINGTDEGGAFARSEAIGHDLHGPHYVVAAGWPAAASDEALHQAAGRVTAALGMETLLARRPGLTVLIARDPPPCRALHEAISQELGTHAGAIGVGGRCDAPSDIPRSFHEALKALEVRRHSRSPNGATSFEDLGIYGVLDTAAGGAAMKHFVHDWLGTLLDYDAHRHSNLVSTLSRYLECGGNYDAAAAALVIHRSTLRYRLQRIREISGHNLTDVDTRLNLHVATRVWNVLGASR